MLNVFFVQRDGAFLSVDDAINEINSWFCGPKLSIDKIFQSMDAMFGPRTIRDKAEGWEGWDIRPTYF